MDDRSARSRKGLHPLGALGAAVLGAVLGLGPFLVPAVAGASGSTSPTLLAVSPDSAASTAPPATVPTAVVPPVTAPPATAPPIAATPTTTTTPAPTPKPSPTTSTTARPPAPSPTASNRSAVAIAPAAKVGPFSFLTLDRGRPVRYDPCQPIHYTANVTLAPRNGLADLQEAVRRMSVVTGLTFVYDGTTTEIPTSRRELHGANQLPSGWPPVVIAWARPGDTDLFTAGSVGEGGSTWSGFPTREVYVTGLVVIDATQNAKLAPGFGGNSLGAVLLHELGHLVGLDHVDDQTQLMYPTVTGKAVEFGTGDLAGLRQLGAEAGCFPAG